MDYDPDDRILWGDTAAPDAPGSPTGVPGTAEGQVVLSWTAPLDRESIGPVSTSTLRNGAYLIFRSTSATDANNASYLDAQISIATTAAPGTPGT
jgi:hypothetical protein